jgi:hypothetical protein
LNILIIGRRGLGKSTLAVSEANNLNPDQIYFDPGAQFANVDFRTSDLEEFFERFESWPEDRNYRLAYVPPHGDIEAHWNIFAHRLWEFIGQHEGGASFVLIVDEAHRLQSPARIDDMLDELIRRSPRRERGDKNPVDLIQTTHYPQDLNRVSWGESDVIFLFNVFHKNARKAIEEQFGPEVAEEVEVLRTPKTGGRDVLKVDSETGSYILLDNETEWYYDIRKPLPQPDTIPNTGIRPASNTELEERYGKF